MSLLSSLAIRLICRISGRSGFSSSQDFRIDLCREVTHEEATAKANDLGIMFMETSAKAGHNVKSLFKKIAMSLPGMGADTPAADAQNTSMSIISLYGKLSTFMLGIDVNSTPANEVPEASQCNC